MEIQPESTERPERDTIASKELLLAEHQHSTRLQNFARLSGRVSYLAIVGFFLAVNIEKQDARIAVALAACLISAAWFADVWVTSRNILNVTRSIGRIEERLGDVRWSDSLIAYEYYLYSPIPFLLNRAFKLIEPWLWFGVVLAITNLGR